MTQARAKVQVSNQKFQITCKTVKPFQTDTFFGADHSTAIMDKI